MPESPSNGLTAGTGGADPPVPTAGCCGFSAPRIGTGSWSWDGDVRPNQRLMGRQLARRLRSEGRGRGDPDDSEALAMGGSAASACVAVGAGSFARTCPPPAPRRPRASREVASHIPNLAGVGIAGSLMLDLLVGARIPLLSRLGSGA